MFPKLMDTIALNGITVIESKITVDKDNKPFYFLNFINDTNFTVFIIPRNKPPQNAIRILANSEKSIRFIPEKMEIINGYLILKIYSVAGATGNVYIEGNNEVL